MRVAALYDVHGNLPALEAVLADSRLAGADLIVSGGDVAAGPFPAECLALLASLGDRVRFVRGNGDRLLDAWPADRLEPGRLDELQSWPLTTEIDVEGLGVVVFCHGSPRSDEEILTALTPADEVVDACAGLPTVVGGHTHVQLDRVAGGTRLVNAGSVGCPYEGRRGAFWALLGPGVELVATEYDVEAAAAAIRDTGYDNADDLVGFLLSPVSAADATDEFERRRRGA